MKKYDDIIVNQNMYREWYKRIIGDDIEISPINIYTRDTRSTLSGLFDTLCNTPPNAFILHKGIGKIPLFSHAYYLTKQGRENTSADGDDLGVKIDSSDNQEYYKQYMLPFNKNYSRLLARHKDNVYLSNRVYAHILANKIDEFPFQNWNLLDKSIAKFRGGNHADFKFNLSRYYTTTEPDADYQAKLPIYNEFFFKKFFPKDVSYNPQNLSPTMDDILRVMQEVMTKATHETFDEGLILKRAGDYYYTKKSLLDFRSEYHNDQWYMIHNGYPSALNRGQSIDETSVYKRESFKNIEPFNRPFDFSYGVDLRYLISAEYIHHKKDEIKLLLGDINPDKTYVDNLTKIFNKITFGVFSNIYDNKITNTGFTIKVLDKIEEMIFGKDVIDLEKLPVGVFRTNKKAIYRWKGRYYKAYRYFKTDITNIISSVHPLPDIFEPLLLGDLADAINCHPGTLKYTDEQGFYFPEAEVMRYYTYYQPENASNINYFTRIAIPASGDPRDIEDISTSINNIDTNRKNKQTYTVTLGSRTYDFKDWFCPSLHYMSKSNRPKLINNEFISRYTNNKPGIHVLKNGKVSVLDTKDVFNVMKFNLTYPRNLESIINQPVDGSKWFGDTNE